MLAEAMDLEAALLDRSVCDARALERSRMVSEETGQSLAQVLLQLGLVSETDLSRTYATMLGTEVLDTARMGLSSNL